MAEIPPINQINPQLPSSSFVPGTGSTPVVSPTDNVTAYSSDITAGGDLTIIGFSKAMISATNELNDTTWQVQQFNATSRRDMYRASIEEIMSLLNLYAKIFKTTSSYSDAFKKNNTSINNVNNKVNNYNSDVGEDYNRANTLNNAINDYNNGSITQAQLQAAINSYNSYANGRNTEANQANTAIQNYNTDLLADNAELQSLYNDLLASGVSASTIAALNLQGTYSETAATMTISPNAPGSPPVAFIPTPTSATLSNITNTMNNKAATDGVELASELFAPSFALLQGQLMITIQMLQNQSNYTGFVQFYFNNVPFIPASFYQPKPAPQSSAGSSEGGGAGSGVALATIVTSLSNSLMESIISAGKATSVYGESILGPTPQIVNQLLYLGLSLLSKIGLQSGSGALRLLQGRLPFIDPRASPAIAAIIGAKLAEEASAAVSSGAILKGVQEILAKAFPGLDEASLKAMGEKLAAVVQLFVLQNSVAQLAQVLKMPDLLDQIFATLPTVKPPPSSQPSPADIVKDDVLRAEIGQNVANAANISNDIIRQAINDAVVNGDYNQGAVVNSLVANGVAEEEAINAEVILRSYIQSEITGRGILDQSVKSNILNQSILANADVSKIVAAEPDITNRGLRDRLIDQFVTNGATPQEAIATATRAVTGKFEPLPVPTALPDILYQKGLDQIAGVGLSPSESQAFAKETIVNTVIEIRKQMDSSLSTLIRGEDAGTTAKILDNYLTSKAPLMEGYVFAGNLRANPQAFVSLMNDLFKPSNFKKDIDIAV